MSNMSYTLTLLPDTDLTLESAPKAQAHFIVKGNDWIQLNMKESDSLVQLLHTALNSGAKQKAIPLKQLGNQVLSSKAMVVLYHALLAF